MRYSDDHKAKTRQRIIDEAGHLFRRDGVGATGLQPLMKTLGLTHGGFYAHFKSKDELVETALAHSAEQLNASTEHVFAGANPLATFIRTYLSTAHCASPGEGCPLPTLSAELGQRGQPSPVTDEIVRNRLAAIEACLPAEDGAEQSIVMLSALVGALVLARSVKDPELSERLLKTARQQLLSQV
ncbi:TetR/AcrR family transcriptional regulator [Pseudomonas sp. EL_65y_Pfl2_R95]|uniref:TetR/AcrR family transcriptional regulator n=1 Tax=Pseudomonas sp. EL_65y_Pfl2_R95 TaxID=3088698 RepID=UPI0030DA4909